MHVVYLLYINGNVFDDIPVGIQRYAYVIMFALMGELNFWTFDDNVHIKATDFGAFKYHDKRINGIHQEEQKVSRKGEVTVEWRTYEVSQQNKLQRIAVISVPLPTHASCVKFAPNQELLLLCCIDGTITMYDLTKATTTSTRAAFIPTLAAWHSDSMIFVVGNDRGQLQHFNIALQCIKSQTLNDETTPANILDLSPYFRNQPALIYMEWNKKNDPDSSGFYNNGNSLFLLLFERGPIGILKVIEGNHLTGDEVVRRYLSGCQVKQATYLLLSMNWDTHPRACMHSLNQILNYLFKLPLTTNHDGLIQNALGSFHLPARPISQAVEEEYGNEVRDLTRRYFHRLLRCRMFEKAFRLAIDLNDHDLFMDIHFFAVALNDTELATAAKERAESILSRSNSRRSSHSTCSRASCSLCSDSSDGKDEEMEEEAVIVEEEEDGDVEEEEAEEEEEGEGEEKEEGETCSEGSGDSRKQERPILKQSKRHNYRKASGSQIPPLPVVHPRRNIENTLSAPYNDIPSGIKTEYNLMSPSFDTSSNILKTISISSPFLASTSFNKPLYKTHSIFTSANAENITENSPKTLNNASDDLMTTSFGSLSLTDPQITMNDQRAGNFDETSYDDNSLLNEIPYSFNDVSTDVMTTQSDSFITTSFNKAEYESKDIRSDYSASALDVVDSNIMSTSFSIRVPSTSVSNSNCCNVSTTNSKSETTPVLRSMKTSSEILNDLSPQTLIDALATNKSSILYSTCNNLMSTSFNDSEDDITSTNDMHINAFSSGNDHAAMKFQHHVMDKKETGFNIPPPPPLSLISTHANYLHNLSRKNYPLSRSTPGLTDIDESVRKYPSYKMTHVPQRLLQRQNSTSNIFQNQKVSLSSRIYRYNYDLDYVPFHHNTCDDMDLQRSQSVTDRKFDAFQNFSPSYSVQRRLLENRHLTRPSPNDASANREMKMSCNVPPLPVINTFTANSKIHTTCLSFGDTISSSEKPKVKFSDTVTHILVPPGTSQVHRQKRPTVQTYLMDPKCELVESLPLGLNNEDYLTDFPSLSKNDMDEKVKDPPKSDDSTKIKVVHFGLL